MIGVRVRANCCCLLLDKGGKPKRQKRRQLSKFYFMIFILLIKKNQLKKSENRLTRNQVIRISGSTSGCLGLSWVLRIIELSGWTGLVPVPTPGFSGWTGRAGPVLTTLFQISLFYFFLIKKSIKKK